MISRDKLSKGIQLIATLTGIGSFIVGLLGPDVLIYISIFFFSMAGLTWYYTSTSNLKYRSNRQKDHLMSAEVLISMVQKAYATDGLAVVQKYADQIEWGLSGYDIVHILKPIYITDRLYALQAIEEKVDKSSLGPKEISAILTQIYMTDRAQASMHLK